MKKRKCRSIARSASFPTIPRRSQHLESRGENWETTRAPQKRFDSKACYALVMTLTCINEDVDLYTEIETEIANRIDVDVDV